MPEKLNDRKLEQVLEWAYKQVLENHGPIHGAIDIAESYKGGYGSPREDAKALVRWQKNKAGAVGFMTGLPGIMTIPVTLPANLASVLFIQIRMIASIAYMGGYDLNDDRVKTLCFTCLVGAATGNKILKQAGITVGQKIAKTSLQKKLPGAVLTKINKAVGFRLLTKFGQRGAINLHKAIPIIGGVIGGIYDYGLTRAIGNRAVKLFLPATGDDNIHVEVSPTPLGPAPLEKADSVMET